jgi:2-C-methyl-D-erythritol 4-phosphate cytidylyltransferase
MKAKTQLIIVAGGLGTRLKHSEPKALVPLVDSPLLIHTLNAFQSLDLTKDAIIVYPGGHESAFAGVLNTDFSPDTEIVLIHDAARPFVQEQTVRDVLDAAIQFGAATIAMRCKDTILQANADGFLEDTPDRSRLWACQTPQVFRREIIEKAYASPKPTTITDDATLVRQSGVPVHIVESSHTNLKITTPNDLQYAEFLITKGLV